MSDAEDIHANPTTSDEHDDPGAGHAHAPTAEPLGPVDVTAWAYALAGGAVGVVLALAMFVARGA